MRPFPFRLGLFGFICLAGLAAVNSPGIRPTTAKAAALPAAAAADLGDPPLIDITGYNDLLAHSRGRAVMVNFWATWCEPCRNEYPMVIELSKEYAPQGLTVIGITLDDTADVGTVRRFLAQMRPDFPNFRERPGIDTDAFYRAVNPEWHGTMPETSFYARDGHLARYFVGDRPRDAFVQAIRLILAVPLGEDRSNRSPVTGN